MNRQAPARAPVIIAPTIVQHSPNATPPITPADAWISLGISAAMLAVALAMGWRSHAPDRPGAPRLVRIMLPSAYFAASLTATVYCTAMRHAPAPAALLAVAVAISLIATVILGVILLGLIDLLLGLLRPTRRLRWLWPAPAILIVLLVGGPALIGWMMGLGPARPQPRLLAFAMLMAAPGLVWWSTLPIPREREVSRVFT